MTLSGLSLRNQALITPLNISLVGSLYKFNTEVIKLWIWKLWIKNISIICSLFVITMIYVICVGIVLFIGSFP